MPRIKLLSWNMTHNAGNWHTVIDSNVDAVLLQEDKAPPDDLKAKLIIDREGDVSGQYFWMKNGH